MTSGFNYQEEFSKCSTMEDITGSNGLVQRMVKDAIEQILQGEMADYIENEKSKGNNPRRNGTSPKKVKMSYGSIDIDVPRVREGEFEPEVIKKRTVIEEGLEAQIVSMYAKGMTVRDIVSHIQALYGIESSPASVSNITDKIIDEAREWYSRTLDSFYPVVFLKYIAYKDSKAFLKVLKRVYGAESEEIARMNLEVMLDSWKKYHEVIKNWQMKWENLSTYFSYDPQIRRLIYTTYTLEGFNRQLRKVTKTKQSFQTMTR